MHSRVSPISKLDERSNRQASSCQHLRTDHFHQRRNNSELRHHFPTSQIVSCQSNNILRRPLLLFEISEMKPLHWPLQHSTATFLCHLHYYHRFILFYRIVIGRGGLLGGTSRLHEAPDLVEELQLWGPSWRLMRHVWELLFCGIYLREMSSEIFIYREGEREQRAHM